MKFKQKHGFYTPCYYRLPILKQSNGTDTLKIKGGIQLIQISANANPHKITNKPDETKGSVIRAIN